jgi:hypothetical protein
MTEMYIYMENVTTGVTSVYGLLAGIARALTVFRRYIMMIGVTADDAVLKVSDTDIISAYVKGLVQRADQGSVPKMVQVAGGNGALADIVNILDKGILTGLSIEAIYITGAKPIGYLKITIDGEVIFVETAVIFATSSAAYPVYRTIPFNHPFSTSLRIEGKCSNTATGTINFLASYTVDS